MGEEIRVVETLVVKDPQARKKLWTIYERGFKKLQERTASRQQSYDEESLNAVLLDPDFIKYLVYASEELVGTCLITTALEKIPWINASYFARRYPEPYRREKVFYLPAVVIDPEHQDLRRIGAKLLHETVTSLGEEGILAVDYSETFRRSLPAFVRRSLGRNFQGEVLDRQVYEVFYYQHPT